MEFIEKAARALWRAWLVVGVLALLIGIVAVAWPGGTVKVVTIILSLIHISEPTRQCCTSRMPSSA